MSPVTRLELKLHRVETMRKSRAVSPWWLESGGDVCDVCGHEYAYATEYRCNACDAAVCCICIVTDGSTEILCVSCTS